MNQLQIDVFVKPWSTFVPMGSNQKEFFPECLFIGASTDALVRCECCGLGTVELKCLFTVRDSPLHSTNLCMTETDGSGCLRETITRCDLGRGNVQWEIARTITRCKCNFKSVARRTSTLWCRPHKKWPSSVLIRILNSCEIKWCT